MAIVPQRLPTRQRLIDEGMRLFAQQGFEATSVGAIEAAAGLQPRRGALYKHFASKQALLEAALRSYLDGAAAVAAQVDELDFAAAAGTDPGALRAIMAALGRWFLEEMDRLEDLTLVLEHDGRRLAEVTAAVKTDVVDLSYRAAAQLIVAISPETPDPEATAVVLLGALVALRRTAWTFGSAPLAIDDDRALRAWAEMAVSSIRADDEFLNRSVAFRVASVSCRSVDHGEAQPGDAGEEAVFTMLYPGLRHFAAAVGPLEVEPDDLVQEALARALAVGPLSELRDPGAYLRTVIVRLAANQRRSLGRRRRAIRFLEHRERDSAAVLESDLSGLSALEPDDRAVVYLSVIEQATADEIGALLGWSAARVRVRKHRALRRLRAALEDDDA